MPDGWKSRGISSTPNGTTRHDDMDGVYRITLEEVFEVGTSERVAKDRRAKRLENIAAELRR